MRYELVASTTYTDRDGDEQSTYPMFKWRCRHCGTLVAPYIETEDGEPPREAIDGAIKWHTDSHR